MLLGSMSVLAYRHYPRSSGRWFAVPGGLVVRRLNVLSGRVSLELFTPSDTELLISPLPPGWEATLASGRRRTCRLLTRRECFALLAAWQSPDLPPEPRLSGRLR